MNDDPVEVISHASGEWFLAVNSDVIYRYKNVYQGVKIFERYSLAEQDSIGKMRNTSWYLISSGIWATFRVWRTETFPGDPDVCRWLSSTTSFFFAPYKTYNKLSMGHVDEMGVLRETPIALDKDVKVVLPDQGQDGDVFYIKQVEDSDSFTFYYRQRGQRAVEIANVPDDLDETTFKGCLGYKGALYWFTPTTDSPPNSIINRLDSLGDIRRVELENMPFFEKLRAMHLVPDGLGNLVTTRVFTLYAIDTNELSCYTQDLQNAYLRVFGATSQGQLIATQLPKRDNTAEITIVKLSPNIQIPNE